MTIDPITVTGGAAAKMPGTADVSAQGDVAAHGGAQNPHASTSVGSAETVDIFDYTSQQNPRALPMDALSPDGQARHYANPTTLGEEVLNYLEGFHKRTSNYEPPSARLASSQQMAAATPTSTGPASTMPTSSLSAVGSTGGDQISTGEERFELVLEIMQEAGYRHTETNLVSGVGQQFSKAMGTLMRGQ